MYCKKSVTFLFSGVLRQSMNHSALIEPRTQPPSPTPLNPAAGALPAQTVGIFYGQLSGLLRAGMPLPNALKTLARDSEAPKFRAALERAAGAMERGESAELAFRGEAGELGGILGQVMAASAATEKLPALLAELSSWTLIQDRIRRQISDALIYPYSVLTLSCIISLVMLAFGRWAAEMPAEMDLGEPSKLQAFLFPHLPAEFAAVFIGAILVACMFFPISRWLSGRHAGLRRWREALLIKLPGFGAVARPLALSRLCGCIAILMKAGRPYHDAVAAAGSLTGFSSYEDAARDAAEKLQSGGMQSDVWTDIRLFPASFRFILNAAQQRGDIPEAYSQLSELYRAEAEARARIVAVVAPPAFLILVGVIVGVMLLSVLGPLVRVLDVMYRIGL